MRAFITTLGLLIWTTSFGQNCFCDKDTTLGEIVNCDTVKFDNGANLYWNFNCDSSWLTFESPKHFKNIIYSLGLVNYTGKIGFSYAQEYKHKFLLQNRLISGCCVPSEFFLLDKTNGQIKDSLGRVIFYSDKRKLPFIIGLADNNNVLAVYNIDKQKKYFIKLSKGEIEKSLKANEETFAEYLFDEPVLKDAIINLTYLLDKPKSEKVRRTKTITIDLKKYSR